MPKKLKKVLVAEDEKPMSKALELKLSKAGFDVRAAYDGEEALNYLEKESFDLVLLDLVMPKADGFKVLEGISQKGIKVKVIIASNLSQIEDLKRAQALGAYDYFVKSDVSINEIVKNVKEALGEA